MTIAGFAGEAADIAGDALGCPTPPRTVKQLGLPDAFLADLLLKHLLRSRESTIADLAKRTALSGQILEPLLLSLREQRAVDVSRRGTVDSQIAFALTDVGRQRAGEAVAASRYCGPAPVPLDQYRRHCQLVLGGQESVRSAGIRSALSDLIVSDDLLEYLGSALNSGRSVYLYGPTGSGKTALAERLVLALNGTVYVPHALWAEDQIITVFDPVIHRVVAAAEGPKDGLDRALGADRRWVEVRRPLVVSGGELTPEALDLSFDPVTRVHGAPPQLKANGGVLIIDDLGRQRVSPRDLINRWIVPLDRQRDYLTLANGLRIEVPFDVRVVFSSNLAPEELADPAFVRRVGYKVHIGAMKESAYRAVVRAACVRHGLTIDDTMIDYLIRRLHARDDQPLVPAIPFDLIDKLRDRARYLGVPVHVSREQLDWAWELYFGTRPRQFSHDGANGVEWKS